MATRRTRITPKPPLANLTIEQILSMSGEEYYDYMRNGGSILNSLKAKPLSDEMGLVTRFCHFGVEQVFKDYQFENTSPEYRMQKKIDAGNWLKRYLPYEIIRQPPPEMNHCPTILAINHQCLDEPLIILSIILRNYPDRLSAFPTNLPWGNGLIHDADFINLLDATIFALITKSTEKKLIKKFGLKTDDLNNIGGKLFNLYIFKGIPSVLEAGGFTVIAPSATRTKKILPNPQCIDDPKAFLALDPPYPAALGATVTSVRKAVREGSTIDTDNTIYCPVTITKPRLSTRYVNPLLFNHKVYFGDPISYTEALRIKQGGKYRLEHWALTEMAKYAPKHIIV